MAVNNKYGATMVNDSGLGGSSIKPKSTPSKLSAVNQAKIASNYNNYVASKNSGNGSGTTTVQASASGGSSGGGGGGFSLDSYISQLRALANDAYNKSIAALNSTRSNTLNSLLESYNASRDALQKQFDASKQNLTDDNASALQQAYIRKMLDTRDLNQLLTAQGLTGGQSETTSASLLNNYNNSRNNLMREFAKNLTTLSTGHETNLADILSNYNDKKAQADTTQRGIIED